MWAKYAELNELKNILWDVNKDLRSEVVALKTNFKPYDAVE